MFCAATAQARPRTAADTGGHNEGAYPGAVGFLSATTASSFPIPALTPRRDRTFLAGLERFESDLGCPVAEADVKWRSHAYAHSPWFNTLIRHPRILDAVEDVIGPNILVWTSTFFIKEPNSPTFAAWHQDGTYFGLQPKEQVCAWVALTDASREAGCMEHLSARGAPRQLHHAALGLKNSINRAGQTIMEPFDRSSPVAMALPAGSFSLHHELSVHRSAPNHASHRRVGIGLNYIPTHVRVDGPVRCRRCWFGARIDMVTST